MINIANTLPLFQPDTRFSGQSMEPVRKQLDAMQAQLQQARQAVSQLDASSQQSAQAQKTAAAERVKQIKEQIRMLMMLGGDPKSMARQIAQLSRELANAARDYAAASKTSNSGQDPVTNNVPDSKTAVNSTSVAADTVPSQAGGSDSAGVKQYQENMKLNSGATGNAPSPVTDEDRKFVSEVRRLASQLKSMASQLAGEPAAPNIEQALKEIEKSISEILTPSSTPAIDVTA